MIEEMNQHAVVSLSYGQGISDYLETLNAPAALLALDQTILLANSRLQMIRPSQEEPGLRVGEALGCMYAQTLGRCGETVACILCKLKNTVEHTLLTGEGLHGVQMSYPHQSEARKTFSITTEKMGSAVLVILG
jgi:hypothetical protein